MVHILDRTTRFVDYYKPGITSQRERERGKGERESGRHTHIVDYRPERGEGKGIISHRASYYVPLPNTAVALRDNYMVFAFFEQSQKQHRISLHNINRIQ